MNKFNDWLQRINEDLDNVPQVSDTPVDAAVDSATVRQELSQQCDDILNSLETLAGELSEDVLVNESELAYMGAAAAAVVAGLGFAAKKLFDFSVAAPMARKKQSKVNDMTIKIAGIEAGLKSADKAQKEKIEQKLEKAKEQRDQLQEIVNDRYSDAPKVVQKALSSEKAKGKLEALNVIMGTASDARKQEIADQLKSLKDKIKEDEAEYAEIGKSAKQEAGDEGAAEVESAQEEINSKEGTQSDGGEEAQEPQSDETQDGEESQEPQSDETQDGEETQEPESDETQDGEETQEPESDEAEDEEEAQDDEENQEEETEEAPVKNSKEDKLARVDAVIKKAEESGNDALLQKAKELKDRISAKESWQVAHTELGRLLEMEISTLEASLIIEGLTIKDRFSKLL